MWGNEQGKICQDHHSLSDHKLSVFADGAAPIWSALHYSGPAKVFTLILMPGEVGEWHEKQKLQWIIPLRGRWRVEKVVGMVLEMGPGEISFGGDHRTK